MRIPEIRKRLRAIADQLGSDYPAEAEELLELAGELRRRSPGPRAPATSTPMSAELEQEIREFAEANPGMSHQAIADGFGVNPGRVSEALHGKRE